MFQVTSRCKVVGDAHYSLGANNRWNGERVAKSVGILKGDGFSWGKRFPIIDEAIIVSNSTKHSGVYQTCWAEPPTVKAYVFYVAITGAHVHYLDCVRRNPRGKRGHFPLIYHYVVLWAHHSYMVQAPIICNAT